MKSPKGRKQCCAVKLNEGGGGITKSFKTIAELAEHVYSEFGEGWRHNVRCKKTADSPKK